MAIKRYFCKVRHQRSARHWLCGLETFLRSKFLKPEKAKKGYERYDHSILAYADSHRWVSDIQVATVHIVQRKGSGVRFVSVVLATRPRLLIEIDRELRHRGFVDMAIMPPEGLGHLVRRLNWQDLITPWAVARGVFWRENPSKGTNLVGGSAIMPSRALFFPHPGTTPDPLSAET